METHKPIRVVIVGGGFAGLQLIKKLAGDTRFQVTLVDRNNYHFFPPLLYQVSSAFIEPSNISYPFRRLFQEKANLRFQMGELLQVHPEQQLIDTTTGRLSYDYLVLGLGTETNYFGMENIRQQALPMKTIDEALHLRNHILLSMEEAVRQTDTAIRDRYLNIVIAGGGPTGVELAGMLAELGHYIAAKEYPEIPDFGRHIYLVDAGPVLLAPMSVKAQREAYQVLEKLGVQIILQTAVKDYTDGTVLLADGRRIPTQTLVWASGVVGRPVPGLPEQVLGRGRRILADDCNRVLGQDRIFVLGDICLQNHEGAYPNGHPQVAQVAIQQGKLLAKNLQRHLSGKSMQPFRYSDKGSMAIISKYRAVADLPGLSFRGFAAWCIWLFIHIIPLVGFRNKLQLAFNWFWSFITNNPTLRLIIRPQAKKV